jgi:alkylation response protein AidB-like acyl-CoA dehydrogenase
MQLPLDANSTLDEIADVVREWVEANLPVKWRDAAQRGRAAIREVRTRADYEAWYPVFAESGLVVATWPVAYGGLDLSVAQARAAEEVLAPFNLGRLNPLGLNNTAPALFAYGTEAQRERFLPPIVRNEERWCQLFSEPGAGSDLASLATRAVRDGDEWVLTGQKVWTTWAHQSEFAICLARTDPSVPKRKGITYFLVDLREPGVTIRPLRHLGGEVDFNEVFLDEVRVPDNYRVGATGDGWRVESEARVRNDCSTAHASSASRAIRFCGSASRRCTAKSAYATGPTNGCGQPCARDQHLGRLRRSAKCTRAR